MYPKKDTCLVTETMSSHFKTVMGILIITLAVMIGLSLLGVVENAAAANTVQENELVLNPNAATLGLGDGLVPEGLKDEAMLGPFDTARGTMDIVYTESNIPDPATLELPLCLTQSFFDPYYVVVEVTGGYHLVCGYLDLYQGEGLKRVKVGTVKINSEDYTPIDPTVDDCCGCCCAKYYKLTFELCGCGPICLDSNNVPDLTGSDFWVCPADMDLKKGVFIDLVTKWAGCGDEDQEFRVILAHKAMSQNPKLPIYISPVKKLTVLMTVCLANNLATSFFF